MDFLTVFLIATGLSMDAFAVAVTSGATIRQLHFRHAFRMALFFGIFQAVMPVFGWLLGQAFTYFVAHFAHWIAFGLLAFVGGKMMYEGLRSDECAIDENCMSFQSVLMLAIATSIDAFAVGVGFSMIRVNIIFPVLVIGIVTFIFSLVGAYIGNRIGSFFENKVEVFGGVVLVGIGIKIVVEHIFF